MREHHPMRYHRMTEILKTVASVKLSSTFLLKVQYILALTINYTTLKRVIIELLLEETLTNVNGLIHFQRICSRLYRFCIRTSKRYLHGVQ